MSNSHWDHIILASSSMFSQTTTFYLATKAIIDFLACRCLAFYSQLPSSNHEGVKPKDEKCAAVKAWAEALAEEQTEARAEAQMEAEEQAQAEAQAKAAAEQQRLKKEPIINSPVR